MARRLSISVPEELYERLRAFRGEMNVSAICARALETELSRREAGDLGPDMLAVVERLQAERGETFQAGYRMGVKYAKEEATFEDFQWFEAHPHGRAEGERLPSGVLQELWETRDLMEQERGGFPPGSMTMAALEDGFREGVLAVWRRVKPYLPGGGEE